MPDIVLTTLNAKYIHTAFGLRYLLANLGKMRDRACIAEFDINQRPVDIAEKLLELRPRIIGLGLYIWNIGPGTELVKTLKRVSPETVLVLGGPEISYETEEQEISGQADYVICGEADLEFAKLAEAILAGRAPTEKVIRAELPETEELELPYSLYDEKDVAHRIVYVEASRGCPFRCEFCLSSLDIPVRQFPPSLLLNELELLLGRGVKQFKFVDRTFNLSPKASRRILEFLLERYAPGRFFHFEMVPDRLPEELREILPRFPAGALQFEVGIQTFNPEVASMISRRQDYDRIEDNVRFLRSRTGVHLHADLIGGLPGETLQSFAAGFDRLVGLGPHEIQVGILKRLRGTPIMRHDASWEMIYNPHPPYEILRNKLIDFPTMQRLRRFARYWDLVGNSGNFVETTPLIWSGTEERGVPASPFAGFMRWSDWVFSRAGRTESIALVRLMELLFRYLTGELGLEAGHAAKALWRDYRRGGRKDKPAFLSPYLDGMTQEEEEAVGKLPDLPKRQLRHLNAPKDRV